MKVFILRATNCDFCHRETSPSHIVKLRELYDLFMEAHKCKTQVRKQNRIQKTTQYSKNKTQIRKQNISQKTNTSQNQIKPDIVSLSCRNTAKILNVRFVFCFLICAMFSDLCFVFEYCGVFSILFCFLACVVFRTYGLPYLFGMTQIINEPTRVTLEGSTSIDRIATTNCNNIVKSGVLTVSVSDHYLAYCATK